MSDLKVVSAGAGSGKTWNLCETIAEKVATGLDPARLLATTFTRKAAAEMKGRIQAKLLAEPRLGAAARVERSERLELAAMGTVHSVGHQLITRYAIALGLSPNLQVLEEDASARCLSEVLAGTDPKPWNRLASLGRAFELEDPQALALSLLEAKRGNRIADSDFQQQMRGSAARLCELLAPGGCAASSTSFEELGELAEKTREDLENFTDTTKDTTDAKRKLRQIAGTARRGIWKAFVEGSRIAAGKTSGANDCLADLRAAGATVRRNPMLHEQIRQFMGLLTEQALSLAAAYDSYKTGRGQVDFTDLEVLFLSLLENPNHTNSLKRDFDLILVDEFQDTNPLQLAIFQRLRALAPESHWVGDPKQSIYGFRGTDPELVGAVWESVSGSSRDRLPKNWRSQAGLVRLVGKLFQPIFGDDAVQEPEHAPALGGIERWVLQTKSQELDARCTACGVAQLRDEGFALRDIAVLARRNKDLVALGSALDSLGVPSLLELPGLLATREGALLLAALRLVADQYDSLAAATIVHLLSDPAGETPPWLKERIRALREWRDGPEAAEGEEQAASTWKTPWAGHPLIDRLAGLDARCLPPSAVVRQVIEVVALAGLSRKWGRSARRAAHLDALVQSASDYEEQATETGMAATLSGLIAHLEKLAADEGDKRLPPYGLDAVTLLTYHKAKGLEWPVVVLTSLDYGRDPGLWSPAVSGGDAGGGDPLKGRTLRYWLWPFGYYGMYRQLTPGSGLAEAALESPEGQQASEAEEQEALRLLYVGFTRAKDKLVLAHRPKKYGWLEKLPDLDEVLDPTADPGEHELADLGTTYIVRHLDENVAEGLAAPRPDEEKWLKALTRDDRSAQPTAERFSSPSSVEEADSAVETTLEELPGKSLFPSGLKEDDYARLGNGVHAYLGALPSTVSLDESGKASVASRCLKGFHAEGFVEPEALVSAGQRFCEWVEDNCGGATWHTEVPVTAPRQAGGQWNGFVDLVLILPSGEAVVIDHKSAAVRKSQCAKKACEYAGQLCAYREALEAQGLTTTETWIHFPLSGVMAKVKTN